MKYNLSNMMYLDFFLSAQNKEDYKAIEPLLITPEFANFPLKSFDIFVDSFTSKMKTLDRENDINCIKEFAAKYKWTSNIDIIFKDIDFEAIVLTNDKQEIIWVNEGFKEMTGFTKKFAQQKTPSFLQGKDTCNVTKERIRENIKLNKPFTDIVINYKKDKTPYRCEIKVFPLFTENTTHYIALEKAV